MPNSAVLLPSGETHDYAPFGQVADPSSLDAAIMALTPWGYWKLGEASGAFADSSGNGRTATTILDPGAAYRAQPAMTSKSGPCVILANGAIGLPLTQTHLGAWSGVFTYMGLCSFDALPAAGSPVGDRYKGSIFVCQATDGNLGQSEFFLGAQDIVDGASLVVGTLGTNNPQVCGAVGMFSIGKPFHLAIVGSSLPGLTWTFDIWINGVRVVTSVPRSASSVGGTSLVLGRLGNTTKLAQVRMSNWAAWTTVLSNKQIMDIAECYFTKADYVANGWMPRTFP